MVGADGRFFLLFSRGSERFEGCRLLRGGSERSGFRVPGVGGGSALKMLGFSDFRECWTFKCWSFGFSDVGILGFADVGLFGFSGMLDFQMFECFCFGLDDFAKIGKLKILRRLRRALINLLAYLQKLQ